MKLILTVIVIAAFLSGGCAFLNTQSRGGDEEVIEEEVGTGVYRTVIEKKPGEQPVERKIEVMKKVTRTVPKKESRRDEHKDRTVTTVYESDTWSGEQPASNASAAPAVETKINFGIKAGYMNAHSNYKTAFLSPGFSGSWTEEKDLGGYGLELVFEGVVTGTTNVQFSAGVFSSKYDTNSFSDAKDYVRETVTSTIIPLRGNLIYSTPDGFYLYGGLGLYYTSIKTEAAASYAAYDYAGFEGGTWDTGLQLGAGLDMRLSPGMFLRLNLEGELFFAVQGATTEGLSEKIGLKYGYSPTIGIIWKFGAK